MITYKQYKILPDEYIKSKVLEFIYEDIPSRDLTTQGVSENNNVIAEIQAVDSLIFSGEKIIPYFFPNSCSIKLYVKDGQLLKNNSIIGTIQGPAKIILSQERSMLNLIQRLCGISSITKEYVQIAQPYNVKILDTRKTTPGLRLFEKYAVSIGGGFNHRLNLSEGILIKDNHIQSYGSISQAISAIKNFDSNLPIELEIDSLNQLSEGLKMNIEGYLLDNMSPTIVAQAVKIIRNYNSGKKIFIEASGGITIKNLSSYLDSGVDAISVGAITHSVISKDIRLEFNYK